MKKLASLVFVGFILLNVMGYYGVFLGIQYHNDRQMTSLLDANRYDESESITIRFPISVPYLSDQHSFERVNGKFEYEGNVYRLVKQMYKNDTLIIVCVTDQKSTEIGQALETYVKTFSDKPLSSKQQGKVSITLVKEYLQNSCVLSQVSLGWFIELAHEFPFESFKTLPGSISTPPPRLVS